MPRNDTGVSEQQKREAVDKALELMRGGLSQKKASDKVADEVGVSTATIRRWADSQGRSLSLVTDDQARQRTEKARRILRTMRIEDYALTVNKLGQGTAEGVDEWFDSPERDERTRGRLAVDMKRVIELDQRIIAMGAKPLPDNDAPKTETDEEREARRHEQLDAIEQRFRIVGRTESYPMVARAARPRADGRGDLGGA